MTPPKQEIGGYTDAFRDQMQRRRNMGKQVNKHESYSRTTMWLLALLMTALVAGCGGGGDSGSGGAGGAGGAGAAPLAIDLGLASTYGIASRAGLSSTGVTVINGDVALSPTATCTDATGGPGSSAQSCLVQTYATTTGMTVNGKIWFAADPPPGDGGVTAANVTTALNTAYTEGMAKANTQPAIAADELGGKTFIPGVYENANLTLAANTVATLDAQNDAAAIFIFKVTLGGDLTDSGTLLLPTRIDLINGAQARNVWFVVGRDATIGSGTTWNGNILADRDVTVNNGSTVMGRVLGGAGGAGAIVLTGAASPSVTTVTVPQ